MTCFPKRRRRPPPRPRGQRFFMPMLQCCWVGMITLTLLHMFWLHSQLPSSDHGWNTFLFFSNDKDFTTSRLKREIFRILECHKIPKPQWNLEWNIFSFFWNNNGDTNEEYDTPKNARTLYCSIATMKSSFTNNHDNNDENYRQGRQRQAESMRLLDIFQYAVDSQIISDETWLRSLLQQAVPLYTTLWDRNVELWAPARDQGLRQSLQAIHDHEHDFKQMWQEISSNHTSESSLTAPPPPPPPLVVNVGSHLGLETLALWQHYPQAHILSLEAAAPNWLYQMINLARNLEFTHPKDHENNNNNHPIPWPDILHRAVRYVAVTEHDHHSTTTATTTSNKLQFLWQPFATATCQSWPSTDESFSRAVTSNRILTHVPERNLDSLVREYYHYVKENVNMKNNKNNNDNHDMVSAQTTATNTNITIDLLILDCRGCEYNVIPTLQASVRQMMGTIHWGYIPRAAKPSSTRAQATHRTMCAYDYFLSRAKECCEFRQSTKPPPPPPQMMMMIPYKDDDSQCHDFEEWAKDQYLYDVPNDSAGWLQKLSMDALVADPQ